MEVSDKRIFPGLRRLLNYGVVAVRLFTNEADSGLSAADINRYPVKHELLSCLAVGGRWVTSHHLLQVGEGSFHCC